MEKIVIIHPTLFKNKSLFEFREKQLRKLFTKSIFSFYLYQLVGESLLSSVITNERFYLYLKQFTCDFSLLIRLTQFLYKMYDENIYCHISFEIDYLVPYDADTVRVELDEDYLNLIVNLLEFCSGKTHSFLMVGFKFKKVSNSTQVYESLKNSIY